PNWPYPQSPRGTAEEANVEECAWIPGSGYVDQSQLGKGSHTAPLMPRLPPHAGGATFTPLHHLDIGQRLGDIDVVQAAKVSGSRFAYISGGVALLQFAIQRLLPDRLVADGFTPIIPPLLVRERSLSGTPHFPEGRAQA